MGKESWTVFLLCPEGNMHPPLSQPRGARLTGPHSRAAMWSPPAATHATLVLYFVADLLYLEVDRRQAVAERTHMVTLCQFCYCQGSTGQGNRSQIKSEILPLAICRRRQWQPTPVLLPGKFHGQRSLVGCSPWGHEELDTTEPRRSWG